VDVSATANRNTSTKLALPSYLNATLADGPFDHNYGLRLAEGTQVSACSR
jgi:hypothetical protein